MTDETTPDPLRELAAIERFHFRLARRMNGEPWKAVWTALGRQLNARFVNAIVRRQLRVQGFEHLERIDSSRPVLLVANHRSFFDMHVVTSQLFLKLDRRLRIFFPIRGRYFYESVGGMLVNLVAAWWAMYPPLFNQPSHQQFDKYSLDVLIDLCREGRGHVIGIHPEGGRNLDPDPYSFRKIQPGTGRIIHAAHPQVVPVFIVGLGNSLWSHIAANWRGGEPIRVYFGEPVDLSEFYRMPAKGSTYKLLTDHVMSRVRHLAEQDRATYAPSTQAPRELAGAQGA